MPKKGRWKQTTDPKTGKTYYYHSKTRYVSWDLPDGFDPLQQTSSVPADATKPAPHDYLSPDLEPDTQVVQSADVSISPSLSTRTSAGLAPVATTTGRVGSLLRAVDIAGCISATAVLKIGYEPTDALPESQWIRAASEYTRSIHRCALLSREAAESARGISCLCLAGWTYCKARRWRYSPMEDSKALESGGSGMLIRLLHLRTAARKEESRSIAERSGTLAASVCSQGDALAGQKLAAHAVMRTSCPPTASGLGTDRRTVVGCIWDRSSDIMRLQPIASGRFPDGSHQPAHATAGLLHAAPETSSLGGPKCASLLLMASRFGALRQLQAAKEWWKAEGSNLVAKSQLGIDESCQRFCSWVAQGMDASRATLSDWRRILGLAEGDGGSDDDCDGNDEDEEGDAGGASNSHDEKEPVDNGLPLDAAALGREGMAIVLALSTAGLSPGGLAQAGRVLGIAGIVGAGAGTGVDAGAGAGAGAGAAAGAAAGSGAGPAPSEDGVVGSSRCSEQHSSPITMSLALWTSVLRLHGATVPPEPYPESAVSDTDTGPCSDFGVDAGMEPGSAVFAASYLLQMIQSGGDASTWARIATSHGGALLKLLWSTLAGAFTPPVARCACLECIFLLMQALSDYNEAAGKGLSETMQTLCRPSAAHAGTGGAGTVPTPEDRSVARIVEEIGSTAVPACPASFAYVRSAMNVACGGKDRVLASCKDMSAPGASSQTGDSTGSPSSGGDVPPPNHSKGTIGDDGIPEFSLDLAEAAAAAAGSADADAHATSDPDHATQEGAIEFELDLSALAVGSAEGVGEHSGRGAQESPALGDGHKESSKDEKVAHSETDSDEWASIGSADEASHNGNEDSGSASSSAPGADGREDSIYSGGAVAALDPIRCSLRRCHITAPCAVHKYSWSLQDAIRVCSEATLFAVGGWNVDLPCSPDSTIPMDSAESACGGDQLQPAGQESPAVHACCSLYVLVQTASAHNLGPSDGYYDGNEYDELEEDGLAAPLLVSRLCSSAVSQDSAHREHSRGLEARREQKEMEELDKRVSRSLMVVPSAAQHLRTSLLLLRCMLRGGSEDGAAAESRRSSSAGGGVPLEVYGLLGRSLVASVGSCGDETLASTVICTLAELDVMACGGARVWSHAPGEYRADGEDAGEDEIAAGGGSGGHAKPGLGEETQQSSVSSIPFPLLVIAGSDMLRQCLVQSLVSAIVRAQDSESGGADLCEDGSRVTDEVELVTGVKDPATAVGASCRLLSRLLFAEAPEPMACSALRRRILEAKGYAEASSLIEDHSTAAGGLMSASSAAKSPPADADAATEPVGRQLVPDSDLKVLIDAILAHLTDREETDPSKEQFLRLLHAVLDRSQWFDSMKAYRSADIAAAVGSVFAAVEEDPPVQVRRAAEALLEDCGELLR